MDGTQNMSNTNRQGYLLYSFLIVIVILLAYSSYDAFTRLYEKNNNRYALTQNIKSIEKHFKERIYFYNLSIKALASNKLLQEYISNGRNKKELQDLFLHMQRSLPDIFQIRYLDANGMEKIRVDGQAASLFGSAAQSRIVEEEKLQNKFSKDYFEHFIDLEAFEVGLSSINLNKDFGKITLPKEPTVRMGLPVFGKSSSVQGVLIFNISLRNLFQSLNDDTLFKVSIADGNGKYLLHSNPSYGLIGDQSDYTLQDEFPYLHMSILSSDHFEHNNIFSDKMDIDLDNQKLFLIIEKISQSISPLEILEDKALVRKYLFMTLFMTIILLLILRSSREKK